MNLVPITGGLPAYLQQSTNLPATNLGAGIAASAPRLGLTITREFTFTKNGVKQILPPIAGPNGQMRAAVQCVFLAAAPTLNKAWFSKPYVPGADAVPDCYSDDAAVPALASEHKQSSTCSTCPRNAFGSHPVTGRGKACGDRKRVVLALASALDEAVIINWPTMSLAALKKLESDIQGRVPLQSLLVELTFDLSVQYSKLVVTALGFVPEETFLGLKDLSERPATIELLREAMYDEECVEVPALVPQEIPVYAQLQAAQMAQPVVQPPAFQPQAVQMPQQSVAAVSTSQMPEFQPAPAKRVRRTKAEMEAARAAAQMPQQQPPAVQMPQQQPPAVQMPQQQPPAVQMPQQQTAANVMDMIAKWKNQG